MRSAIRWSRAGRPAIFSFVLLLLAGPLAAPAAGDGQIVENPAKPTAKNAGRIVTLTEVLAISDEGTTDYYFKWPHALKTGPDGSLVLIDRDQVLRFDKNGKFQGNFLKKGQGPGEVTYPGACLATVKNTIIISNYPNKIVFLDLAGKFEKEIPVRQEGRTNLSLLSFHGGAFIFRAWDFPRTTGDPDIIDTPQTIVSVSEATGDVKTLTTFLTKVFVITSSGGGGGMFDITSLIAAPIQERYLALSHTEEYLLKIYDPAANKVVREFRRNYDRIKGHPLTESEKKGGILINGQHYTVPQRRFENDIKNVLTRDGEIWALTSTKDKAKGALIDVFDGEGVYQDCFWLKLPEAALKSILSPGQCVLDGDFLWIVERSEDETFAIMKYRVVI